jgi:hypothetical protein
LADGRRTREASHDLIQRPPSISSWPGTKKAGPASEGVKTKQSNFPESG